MKAHDENEELSSLVRESNNDDDINIEEEYEYIRRNKSYSKGSVIYANSQPISRTGILTSILVLALGAFIGAGIGQFMHGDDGNDGEFPSFESKNDVSLSLSTKEESNVNTTDNNNQATIVKPKKKHVHPPLSQLINEDKEIIGDVSWILDFAVAGFPKCGTSYLMRYIEKSHRTHVNDHELCILTFNRPTELVEMYYNISRTTIIPSNDDNNNNNNKNKNKKEVKVGLKCPKDLESKHGLPHYARYFPTTDFVITTRHPILWFQSFYNFRVYQHYPKVMPRPNDLIGPCRDEDPYLFASGVTPGPNKKQNVCTDRSKFHWTLARLGKTSGKKGGGREEQLLEGNQKEVIPMQGKVFLMEIDQVMERGKDGRVFSRDFSKFLGLGVDGLPQLYDHIKPNKYSEKRKTQKFMNICDSQYQHLREVLLQNGKDAREWIRDYFLKSEDVVVSQKDMFLGMLDNWLVDPCQEEEGRRRVLSLMEYDPFV